MTDRLTLLEAYPFDSKFAGYDSEGYPIYDRAVDASWLREALSKILKDGIFPDDAYAFQVQAGTSGLNVSVNAGIAIIGGAVGGWRGEARTVELLSTPPQGDVICSVLLRYDNNEDFRSIYLVVREGVIGAVEPPAPAEAPSVKELRLGYVKVPSGATSLTEAVFVDERGTDVCPYATPFEHLDLSAIFAETRATTEAYLGELSASVDANLGLLESALDGTTAGHLQNQINDLPTDADIDAAFESRKDVDGGYVSYGNYTANAVTPDGESIVRADGNVISVDAAVVKERMGFGSIASLTYGSENLSAGESALDNGAVYFVYE